MADGTTLLMGAVAYDPKVVTIWDGFRAWFATQDLDFDYVLYSNYERQVEALMAGHVDVAWNSPLAWIRAAGPWVWSASTSSTTRSEPASTATTSGGSGTRPAASWPARPMPRA